MAVLHHATGHQPGTLLRVAPPRAGARPSRTSCTPVDTCVHSLDTTAVFLVAARPLTPCSSAESRLRHVCGGRDQEHAADSPLQGRVCWACCAVLFGTGGGGRAREASTRFVQGPNSWVLMKWGTRSDAADRRRGWPCESGKEVRLEG